MYPVLKIIKFETFRSLIPFLNILFNEEELSDQTAGKIRNYLNGSREFAKLIIESNSDTKN